MLATIVSAIFVAKILYTYVWFPGASAVAFAALGLEKCSTLICESKSVKLSCQPHLSANASFAMYLSSSCTCQPCPTVVVSAGSDKRSYMSFNNAFMLDCLVNVLQVCPSLSASSAVAPGRHAVSVTPRRPSPMPQQKAAVDAEGSRVYNRWHGVTAKECASFLCNNQPQDCPPDPDTGQLRFKDSACTCEPCKIINHSDGGLSNSLSFRYHCLVSVLKLCAKVPSTAVRTTGAPGLRINCADVVCKTSPPPQNCPRSHYLDNGCSCQPCVRPEKASSLYEQAIWRCLVSVCSGFKEDSDRQPEEATTNPVAAWTRIYWLIAIIVGSVAVNIGLGFFIYWKWFSSKSSQAGNCVVANQHQQGAGNGTVDGLRHPVEQQLLDQV